MDKIQQKLINYLEENNCQVSIHCKDLSKEDFKFIHKHFIDKTRSNIKNTKSYVKKCKSLDLRLSDNIVYFEYFWGFYENDYKGFIKFRKQITCIQNKLK